MDPFEREERDVEMRYSRVTPVETFRFSCPRCFRGIRSRLFLRRPFWREDGPSVCGTCIRWEQKDLLTEERRKEHIEHLRELR